MPDSLIEVTSLTATGGVGQNTLGWSVQEGPCLSYLKLDKVEVWAASSNDRGLASKVGEVFDVQFTHAGLSASVTRYYWVRPRDVSANYGDWYPLSETAGVSATTLTTEPGPNSVGPDELQDGAVQTEHIANAAITNAKIGNAEITSAKIQSLSASKITAGTISASISMDSPTITGGSISGVDIDADTINSFEVQSPNIGTSLSTSSGNLVIRKFGGNSTLELNAASSAADRVVMTGSTSSAAITVTAQSSAAGNHGIRASSEGRGLVGASFLGGGYAFYSELGGYGPFTGQHDAFLRKDSEAEIGDIVDDDGVLACSGVDEVVTKVVRSSAVGSKQAAGILSRRMPFDAKSIIAAFGESTPDLQWLADNFDRLTINALGEGQMNVCGRGGDIEAGDYICTSDLAGKGQRQNDADGEPDDLLRRCTVAQAREAVHFDHPDQVKRVAVFYRCG